MKLIQKTLLFFELRSFGVCSWWAKKLGIESSKVRLGFIYTSFVTLGSPLVLYIAMAWILEHKHYFKLQKKSKNSIWEL
ncbi:MAG: PspC family transcriptional regulator [Crocinitomicaceae bacterium]|nr:PspC family transcriptional regulator [Crocinitomicaceae bacterium]